MPKIRDLIIEDEFGLISPLDNVLQAAKRKARGYKAKHFMTIAYLLTGKLSFFKVNKFCSTHSF